MTAVAALGALALAFWVVAPLVGFAQASMAASIAAGEAICPTCGPRPESDAHFCSNCGAGTGRRARS